MSIKISGVECINDDKRFLNNEDRPTIQPTLNLDFAKTKTLDPRITFTRSSTATYYDGKTFAKAEENLLKYSEEFDNGVWGKGGSVTLTANFGVDPSGETTADRIQMPASSSTYIQQYYTFISGVEYTFSVWAKATSTDSNFDLFEQTAGVPTLLGTQTATSGWQRFSFTFTASSSASKNFGINNGNDSYASDILIWGAQLEQRDSVTAYTPTTYQPITNYIPVLQTAASGAARFDHDPVTGESKGLLIEEQRTNLLTYSEAFDNAAWSKSGATVTSNTIVAPDGTMTGDKIVEDTSTGLHIWYQNITASANTHYTLTVYVKPAGRSHMQVQLDNTASSSITARFDLSDGSIEGTVVSDGEASNGTASSTYVGNGWYRLTVSGVPFTTGTTARGLFYIITESTGSYTGDGYSGIYVWGAQLEEGAFPTSYIPTSGSQVTRILDKAEMIGITDIVSGYQGSVYWEAESQSPDSSYRRVWTLYEDVAAYNDRINFNSNGANNYNDYYPILFFIKNNDASSSASLRLDYPYDWQPSTYYKGAAYWEGTTGGLCLAGGDVVTTDNYGFNTSSTDTHQVPMIDILTIGGDYSSTAQQLQGTIKKLVFYPEALTTAQLQALTEE